MAQIPWQMAMHQGILLFGRENHKQRTDAEYADEMMAFIGDTPYTCVVVDPSAASFITELQRRGLKVLKADNAVLDGIRTVCTLLQRADLLFSKDCTRTIAEFYAYRWYDKAAEAGGTNRSNRTTTLWTLCVTL